MNIHEYQAKEILKKFGANVPNGVPIFSLNEMSGRLTHISLSLQAQFISWSLGENYVTGGNIAKLSFLQRQNVVRSETHLNSSKSAGQQKLNFNNGIAFENYQLYTDPMIYEHSTIDIPPGHKPVSRGAEEDYFTLFEFSAKWDPVPTMLTQNHVGVINGFMGQTTSFNKNYISLRKFSASFSR